MKTYITPAVLLILFLIPTGCTSDIFDIKKESEHTGILLSVTSPDIKANTRAAANANTESPEVSEGIITNLTLFAYPSAGEGERFSANLSEIDKNSDGKYELSLKPGSYRIYTIANIRLPLDLTEETLKAGVITAQAEHYNPDGSIPASGIPMTAEPGDYRTSEDGELYGEFIEIKEGEKTPIFCNLTFSLVKIRISVLQKEQPVDAIGEITISNQSASEPLFPLDDGTFDYGILEPHSLATSNNAVKTYYLPERIVSNTDDMTTISFPVITKDGEEKSVEIPLGSNSVETEDGTELPASPRKLLRGHLYDYTFTDDGKWSLKISDWNQKVLVYDLNKQTYLDIDRSSVELQSAEITHLGYDTNAPQLKFKSPLFDNSSRELTWTTSANTVDLLLFSTTQKDGKRFISIRVNPYVKSYINQINGISNFPFSVIANNIEKKVSISSLECQRFLRVFPEEIELDIEQLRADGIDQITVPITWESNMLTKGKYNCQITKDYQWQNDNITLSSPSSVESSDNAYGTNTLTIKNLLSSSFWNTGKTIRLIYKTTFNDNQAIKEVKIKVVPPKNSDYTIYFYFPTEWSKKQINAGIMGDVNPHIFIYQELTLPNSGIDPDRQGKRVAVSAFKPDVAAYEYVFTSKVVFKGWKGFDSSAPDINDPFGNGSINNNFVIFDNASFDISSGANQRYDFSHDFNENLRKSTICPKCKINSTDNNLLEPGICMENPNINEGWRKYTLNGIADPEKTFIRFYAHHDLDICYPPKDAPALKLFNFKDREGWLDLDANMKDFSDDKPDQLINLGINYKSPIYWEASKKWEYIKIIDFINVNNLEKGKIYPKSGYFRGTDKISYDYFNFSVSDFLNFSLKFQLLSDKDGNSTSAIHTIPKTNDINNLDDYKIME